MREVLQKSLRCWAKTSTADFAMKLETLIAASYEMRKKTVPLGKMHEDAITKLGEVPYGSWRVFGCGLGGIGIGFLSSWKLKTTPYCSVYPLILSDLIYQQTRLRFVGGGSHWSESYTWKNVMDSCPIMCVMPRQFVSEVVITTGYCK